MGQSYHRRSPRTWNASVPAISAHAPILLSTSSSSFVVPPPLQRNARLQRAAAVRERVPHVEDFNHDVGLVEHGGEMWQGRVEEWR